MPAPTVLVPLADGFEEIEAITVIDILRRAGVEVTAAGVDGRTVHASRGVTVEADALLDEVADRDYDLVVLPGGAGGAKRLTEDARVQALIRRQHEAGRSLGAICAAPMALVAAGVLGGRRATSFPGFLQPGDAELSEEPVVHDRGVTTSRGPGTAMPFALALVEQLCGADKRDEVESRLQIPAA
ncbi:DJ-1 family protein [Salinisphaera sp. PC39]|uniref:DJ-1 family glyoxalase III n=1 Tax=Salinisphaera sp. PC39 TaxID=1304156 RepID=UPI00333E6EFB